MTLPRDDFVSQAQTVNVLSYAIEHKNGEFQNKPRNTFYVAQIERGYRVSRTMSSYSFEDGHKIAKKITKEIH